MYHLGCLAKGLAFCRSFLILLVLFVAGPVCRFKSSTLDWMQRAAFRSCFRLRLPSAMPTLKASSKGARLQSEQAPGTDLEFSWHEYGYAHRSSRSALSCLCACAWSCSLSPWEAGTACSFDQAPRFQGAMSRCAQQSWAVFVPRHVKRSELRILTRPGVEPRFLFCGSTVHQDQHAVHFLQMEPNMNRRVGTPGKIRNRYSYV